MMRVRARSVWAVAVAAVLVWNTVARAQTTPATPGTPGLGQHPFDNVSFGALAARSPGNMVSAGLARVREAADFARGGIEIVETTVPTSPGDVFLADAIEIIFDQLKSVILLFENVLRLRAGLPPLVPQVTPTTTVDENVDGESTGDVNIDELRDLVGDK